MLTAGNFLTGRDACQPTGAGPTVSFQACERRRATEAKRPVFGCWMSDGRMLKFGSSGSSVRGA